MGLLWPAGAALSKAARQSVEVATAAVVVAAAAVGVAAAAVDGGGGGGGGGGLAAVTTSVTACDPTRPVVSVARAVIRWTPAGSAREKLPPLPIWPTRFEVHRRVAVRFPSWLSLAEPENVIEDVSDTEMLFAGELIVTEGAVLLLPARARRIVLFRSPRCRRQSRRQLRPIAETRHRRLHRSATHTRVLQAERRGRIRGSRRFPRRRRLNTLNPRRTGTRLHRTRCPSSIELVRCCRHQ